MENHNFTDEACETPVGVGFGGGRTTEGDGGTSCFIQGEEVRVVVVEVKEGRIADRKGGVKDWSLVVPGRQEGAVNGI